MKEEFVSEPITPAHESMDASAMAIGEPGLPKKFTWRDKEYTVEKVLAKWKESGPCKHGSGEMYLRKHWFQIRTTSGYEMKVYFERQPRSKRESKTRWWLYTISNDCNSEQNEKPESNT